jgi:NitT/TauT family transport system substrate-binding protein
MAARLTSGVVFALVAQIVLTIHAPTANAEVTELKVARQFGISFLPLLVMQDKKLFEKYAKAAGLSTQATYLQISGGTGQNEALLSGSIQIASGGVPPFAVFWARTRGTNNEVKAITAKNCAPIMLLTRDPRIKSIRDFTEQDKIAMPATKVSGQAIILQMATQKEYGKGNEFKFDNLQVAMPTPDATIALLSGGGEINNHFSEAPFEYQELKKPGVRMLLKSYDVLGGKTTYNLVWTTTKFHQENPKTYKAFLDAFQEAIADIHKDRRGAAETYVRITKEKITVDEVLALINDPDIEFTMTPRNMMKIVDFMAEVGHIKAKPQSWKDMFFPEVHHLSGS